MVPAQNTSIKTAIEPQTVGTSAVSGYVDTYGFDYAQVVYVGGPVATGGLPAALKIQHGDTTSAFTDISGAAGGTDATNGFTIPTPNTSTGNKVIFDVNMDGKKRYLNLTTTGTATTRTVAGMVVLSRARSFDSDSTTDRGCDVLVQV